MIDAAIGQCDDVLKKPAPDGVFKAMKLLGADFSNTVYVGDSDVDVLTAKNSGLPCIGVTWGFRDKSYLEGAEFVIDKPYDIINVIGSL